MFTYGTWGILWRMVPVWFGGPVKLELGRKGSLGTWARQRAE